MVDLYFSTMDQRLQGVAGVAFSFLLSGFSPASALLVRTVFGSGRIEVLVGFISLAVVVPTVVLLVVRKRYPSVSRGILVGVLLFGLPTFLFYVALNLFANR